MFDEFCFAKGLHLADLLDPNSLTSAAFNRKAFAGLSADAVAAVSAGDASLAQGSAYFGQPHPHELDIAPAWQAFFDNTPPSYVAAAAADAWTKTLARFHRCLA